MTVGGEYARKNGSRGTGGGGWGKREDNKEEGSYGQNTLYTSETLSEINKNYF